jgi:nitroimidazol reductase NimA-like FMN-containing flavoprotein (pyridoxamine 5'-phosphate oxidase superfamily)
VSDTRHVSWPDTRNPTVERTNDLSTAECHRLLRTQTVGRVGTTSGGLPCILPVYYAYEDGVIVFRTGTGTKLRAAASGDVLAFQVDSIDATSGTGWSVLVLGRASVLTTTHEHDGLPTLDSPREHGELNHYVRLHCELVTGRILEMTAHSAV